MSVQAAEQVVIDMMSKDIEVIHGYEMALLNDLVRVEYPFTVEPFKRFAAKVDDNGHKYGMYELRTEMREWIANSRKKAIKDNVEFERREGNI